MSELWLSADYLGVTKDMGRSWISDRATRAQTASRLAVSHAREGDARLGSDRADGPAGAGPPG